MHNVLPLLWCLVVAHIAASWWSAVRHGLLARRLDARHPAPPPAALPPVSVIVPAWNERTTIGRNIAALRQIEYPTWEALIVAGGDDGTYDSGAQAAAGDTRLKVLSRGPEPKNAALKRGIAAARYDIVVLLDCDNTVEPGWLAALIAPLAQGASISVGDSRPNRITWVTIEEQMWNIYIYQILKLSWIQGDRSIAIRRELLDRIGGLPEHTYAREDWDIWARLGETGERVIFAEGARLTTDRPATLAESWRHQVRWRRTHLTGLWEHRARLLGTPAQAFSQIYGYLLSAVVGLLSVVALFVWVVHPAARQSVLQIALPAAAWLCLRRAALGGAIAANTGDRVWLLRCWMPIASLGIELAASLVALVSPAELTALYKGPRHAEE